MACCRAADRSLRSPALAALCDALVMPTIADEPAAIAAMEVEHAGKPEWGRGRVVDRRDGKLTIEFPGGVGKKFLRFL